MNEYGVKRLAEVLAIRAEIEGMKADNTQRLVFGHEPEFMCTNFEVKAEELRIVAAKHNDQL